jgi:hypothetical protein
LKHPEPIVILAVKPKEAAMWMMYSLRGLLVGLGAFGFKVIYIGPEFFELSLSQITFSVIAAVFQSAIRAGFSYFLIAAAYELFGLQHFFASWDNPSLLFVCYVYTLEAILMLRANIIILDESG